MRKIFNRYQLALFSLFFFFSCTTVNNNHKTMIDVITHFDDCGLKAEKIYPALADVIKAEAGAVLVLDGYRFEVYKYNLKNPIQQAKLKKIADSGEISILGIRHKVIVRGSFVLLNYQGHPREAEIIAAFERF